MMQLNRQKAIELNNALSAEGLKAKHLGAENFMTIITEKVKLKKALVELSESEFEVCAQSGGSVAWGQMSFPDANARVTFDKLVKPLHDKFSIEIKTNFIPEGELKEYVKEQDTSVAAILFEYLLKDS